MREAVVGKVGNADVPAPGVLPAAPLEAAALDTGPPGMMEEPALEAIPLEGAPLEAAPPEVGATGPPGTIEDTTEPEVGFPTLPLEAAEVAVALLNGLKKFINRV